MTAGSSPCYGCPERHEACHDSCTRYKAWKAPLEAAYEDRKHEKIRTILREARVEQCAKKRRKSTGRR